MAATNQRIGEAPLRRTTTPISKCAFCTFPNKSAAAGEFANALARTAAGAVKDGCFGNAQITATKAGRAISTCARDVD